MSTIYHLVVSRQLLKHVFQRPKKCLRYLMACILGGFPSITPHFTLSLALSLRMCLLLYTKSNMYNLIFGLFEFENFTACHAQFAKRKMVILCTLHIYMFYELYCEIKTLAEMSNCIFQTVTIFCFFFLSLKHNAKNK